MALDHSPKMDSIEADKETHDIDDAPQSMVSQPVWTDDEEKAVTRYDAHASPRPRLLRPPARPQQHQQRPDRHAHNRSKHHQRRRQPRRPAHDGRYNHRRDPLQHHPPETRRPDLAYGPGTHLGHCCADAGLGHECAFVLCDAFPAGLL
ncbi:hypothetical protein LB505_006773 [Fusarium chuoi]|nr:hypothetical protein LB505_006773 [Fusarium chuoi]